MPSGTVNLALVGDLLAKRPDPGSIFDLARQDLQPADITFGNLEGPLTDVGQPPEFKKPENALRYVAGESMVSAYLSAGFDVVSLANNHTMNMGPDGLLRCIEVLDRHGIAHAGAGRNKDEAHQPAVLERNGTRFAFLAYTSIFLDPFAATADRPGVATVKVTTSFEQFAPWTETPGSAPIIHCHPVPEDVGLMLEDVRSAKHSADVVVVSWHWGISSATGQGHRAGQIIDYQIALGHAAVDAGADLIVGHHPHQLEGIEVYEERPIFYSLGNFAFDPYYGARHRQTTAVAQCVIRDGSVLEASFIPYCINDAAQPYPASPSEAEEVLEEIRRKSAEFSTDFRTRKADVLVFQAPAAVPAR